MELTLNDFFNQYDQEGSIILLEGKRNVLEIDQPKLTELGKILALGSKFMRFRSGNADGADYYFSLGVSSVDKSRLQVITPYTGHRNKANLAYQTISLDDINLAKEPEVVYLSKQNKKMGRVIDQYVTGNKGRYAIKAAYILRDTIKVIGTESILPATFGIFYDDLENPVSGGTGHTMRVCEQNKLPLIDQTTWFKWLIK